MREIALLTLLDNVSLGFRVTFFFILHQLDRDNRPFHLLQPAMHSLVTIWKAVLGLLLGVNLVWCSPVPIPGTHRQQPAMTDHHPLRQSSLWEYATSVQLVSQGEGCCSTTAATRASDWENVFIQQSAKSGKPLPVGFGPDQRSRRFTQVQKRSYHRACKRASLHGATWYRGKYFSDIDIPIHLRRKFQQGQVKTPAQQKPVSALPASDASRLKLLTWNPGGMGMGTLNELRLWLRTHPHDLVIIPETKWSFSRCWQDDRWHYIHSSSDLCRVGGVLVMIARRLIPQEHIGYEEVIAGRILHVRLHFIQYAFDILAIYQHADDHSVIQMQKRQHFWDTLDNYIYNLPSRNQLVCCGDFNCALPTAPPWVGTKSFRWQGTLHTGHQHRDMPRFLQLLKHNALVATNTWSSQIGPSYFHGMYAARIDFFLIRLHSCDGLAKLSHYLPEAEFLPMNLTHHFPLVLLLPKRHMAFHRHRYVPACTYRQRANCRTASQIESPAWLHLSQHVAQQCQDRSGQLSWAEDSIFLLHHILRPKFQELFPDGPQNEMTATVSSQDDTAEVRNKWHYRRLIHKLAHQPGPMTSHKCFQAWFCWSRFRQLQRAQQRRVRQVRSQRFHQLCAEATEAANVNDAHGLFTIINRFSPKRPLLRARLKTSEGKIADQFTAHALTVEHIQQMWQRQVVLHSLTDCIPGVPFQCIDVERAIMQLHPNRSVASPFLPAVVWQSAPRELATYVMKLLSTWWTTTPPFIPQEWRDAWLFFLPKPGKPCTHPSQLRPISLMEPVGKLILGLLTDQLKQFHFPRLSAEPHFGFLPKRGALDAVTRVATHCNLVRTLVNTQKRTIARQMASRPLYSFCGGLQMYLDLRHAFDSVYRPLLFQHLHDLQTPDTLLQLFTMWHTGTRYNIVFQGQTTMTPVDTGLRQGCKAAPLLWVLFMNKFLQMLTSRIDPAWIAQTITLYADDIHIGTTFFSEVEFKQCLERFGQVLDVIEELKLTLSYEKTFILFAATGSRYRRCTKGIIERQSNGTVIHLPRGAKGKSAIPLRSKAKYLGTELSYGSYECQTWQMRLKAARSAFARLQCWFKSRQFPSQHRVHLWKVCVHSILTYGLCATNVTVKVLHEYQQVVYQMMRRVLHDHAYRTRNTHSEVFEAHGIDLPLQILANYVHGFWRRLQRRALALQSNDFLHQVNWTHLPEMLRLIHCVAASTVEAPIAASEHAPVRTQATYSCPCCDFHTDLVANLRRHMTHVHALSQYRTHTTSPLDMTKQGRPQCKHCHAVFTTWRRFFIHVERNCCQHWHMPGNQQNPASADLASTTSAAPADSSAHPSPTTGWMPRPATQNFAVVAEPFWPLLRSIALDNQMHRLTEHPQIGESLAHHCVICSMWCSRCQELNAHLRLHHSDSMPGVLARGAQLTRQLDSQSPCVLCSKPFRRGHCCPVMTQVALLQLQELRPEDRDSATRTCTLCDHQFDSMTALHQHLSQRHDTQVHDWCPSRDTLQNSTACSHCGTCFVTRSGVQRHILDGRCSLFNPDASPQPLDAAGKWMDKLTQGDFTRQALSPAQRQELTLVCQMCGSRYSRQNDLGAHLQQSHGPLWTASQELVRFLIQAVLASHGCQCNPCSHEQGKTHVCVMLRQIAMMFLTSTNDVLVPTQFVHDLVVSQLQPINHLPLHTELIDVLLTRQFEKLWQTPGITGLLRQWCLCCGDRFHPAALVVHHWQHHGMQSQWASQIKFQLIGCLLRLQDQDTQCNFCGLFCNATATDTAFSDPERLTNLQTHFVSNCPIVHQVALLLHPQHGRSNAGTGQARPGATGVFSTARTSLAGSQPVPERKRRGTTTQTGQSRSKHRRPGSKAVKTAGAGGHDGDAEGHGDPVVAARTVDPVAAQTGLLRYLCASQSTGSRAVASPDGGGLEEDPAAESRQSEAPDTQNVLVQRTGERDPLAGAENEQEPSRRRSMGSCPAAGNPAAGRFLDIPEMESRGSVSCSGIPSTSEHGPPSEAASAPGRTFGGFGTHCPLSQPESAENSGTVVPAAGYAPRRSLAHHERAAAAWHVESTWTCSQNALPNSESTSSNSPTMPSEHPLWRQEQGEGEATRQVRWSLMIADGSHGRQQLRHAFRSLIMDNSSFFCYANCALLTFLWSTLCRTTYTLADWGEFSDFFCSILLNHENLPYSLEHSTWFQNLIATWSERNGQADSAEFSSIMLRGVAPQCCSNQWERRVLTEQNVRVHDSSHDFMPIVLQLDLELTDSGSIRLIDLIRHWHQELGMCAGLVNAQDLICLHLDRFVRGPTGQVRKDQTPIGFHWGVPFPVLTDGVNCSWENYGVVAAFAHQGDADRGHYQAVLNVDHPGAPGEEPALWLHCDDNRQPQPYWHLPPEFAANVTCFWLCRCDRLELHDMRWTPDMPRLTTRTEEELDQAMLALLRTDQG